MSATAWPRLSKSFLTQSPYAGIKPRVHSERQAWPIALMGVVFDNVTLVEAVGRIEHMIKSRRPHHVVTANVDFLAQAHRDEELQRIFLNAQMVVCDGTPLIWASRFFGTALPERVAGADLVPELMRLVAKKRHRVFFLGTTEETNRLAIARLRGRFPGLEVDHYSPPFQPLAEMDNGEIIRRIQATKPDLLLVAFGCPKAEKWIARHGAQLDVPVCIGVGATIDFMAGRMKRAPQWMQQGGVEWIFRLWQEPKRLFKRYATDLAFFCGALFRQWWQWKLPGSGSRGLAVIQDSKREWLCVKVSGAFTKSALENDARLWDWVAQGDRHCLLTLDGVRVVDASGLGLIAHLRKKLAARGRKLILVSPTPAFLKALRQMKWSGAFEIAPEFSDALKKIGAAAEKPPCPQEFTALVESPA